MNIYPIVCAVRLLPWWNSPSFLIWIFSELIKSKSITTMTNFHHFIFLLHLLKFFLHTFPLKIQTCEVVLFSTVTKRTQLLKRSNFSWERLCLEHCVRVESSCSCEVVNTHFERKTITEMKNIRSLLFVYFCICAFDIASGMQWNLNSSWSRIIFTFHTLKN